MPSVTEAQHASHQSSISPTKKRRRDPDATDGPLPMSSLFTKLGGPDAAAAFYDSPYAVLDETGENTSGLILDRHDEGDYHHHHHHQMETHVVLPRKILPLPVAKRLRLHDVGRASTKSPPRVALQDQTSAGNRTPPPRTTSSLLLNPCHICHRRPTKKSDLDSFADCQGCGARTCFVCIRECLGWLPEEEDHRRHHHHHRESRTARPANGTESDEDILYEQEMLSRSFHMDDVSEEHQDRHSEVMRDAETSGNGLERRRGGREDSRGWAGGGHRQMVCSRCCIERGTEGDVVCLGCLSGMEAV